MPRVLAWEELWDCPQKRPFWCSHPHCLWCNWDEEDSSAWILAAFLGPTLPYERHYDPRYPESHYIQDRRYVAWLCEECADDAALVRWFADRVGRYYPWASIVQSPATPNEQPLAALPAAPVGRIVTAPTAWAAVAINDTIRKGLPPVPGYDENGNET
jgi:hypothetical protein